MKIHPVGAEFFHADRGTDETTLIVAFRNFANASKNIEWDEILVMNAENFESSRNWFW